MTEVAQPPGPTRAAFLLIAALLIVLAAFPPEARGEARAGCAVLIGLLALVGWRAVAPVGPLLIVAGVGVAIPLALASRAPGAAVEPLSVALLGAALGLAVAGLDSDGGRGRRAAGVLGALGAGVSLHAVYQALFGLRRLADAVALDPTVPDREAVLHRLGQGRGFASFATPAALGGFLGLALPVTLALALAEQRPRSRRLWFGAAALQGAGLLATASATAAAALLGALLLAALCWRLGGRITAAGVAVLALAIVGIVALRGPELLSLSDGESPWRLRAGNFRAAADVASEHPLRGVGPGGFSEAYPAHRQPGDNEVRHVHDLPLELAAEWGWFLGGLLTLLFFVVFLGPLWRERSGPLWRRGMAVGLAAFALHNLADFTAFLPSLLWSACLLRGLLARPTPLRRAAAPLPALAGVSLAAVMLAAMLSGFAGVSWNHRVAARQAAFAGEHEAARTHAAAAARLAPWNVDAALMLARVSTAGGDADSLALADRAVRLSPARASARRLRARLRLRAGDAAGAFTDLREAVRLYPLDAELAQALRGLRASMDVESAR